MKSVGTLAPYTSSAAQLSTSAPSSAIYLPSSAPYGTGAQPSYPVATGTVIYYPSASYSIVPATGQGPAKVGIGAGCIVLAGLNGLVWLL